MRRHLFVFAALAVLFPTSAAMSMPFVATLSGDQEVGPVVTDASGTGQFFLNMDQDRLEIHLTIVGLDLDGNQTPDDDDDDVTGLHLHAAPAGVNGGVVFGLISPNNDENDDLVIDAGAGTLFSAWDLNEGNGTTLAAELSALLNDGLYINVHTVGEAGGEIRGQVLAVPEPATLALLSGGLAACGFAIRRRRAVRS